MLTSQITLLYDRIKAIKLIFYRYSFVIFFYVIFLRRNTMTYVIVCVCIWNDTMYISEYLAIWRTIQIYSVYAYNKIYTSILKRMFFGSPWIY